MIRWRDTGDYGRVTKEGLIYYVGREDSQIKRLGKRLNLEEINQVLLGYVLKHYAGISEINISKQCISGLNTWIRCHKLAVALYLELHKPHPGLTLSEFVVANTLAKLKKLEPNEIDFRQRLS